MSHLFLCKPLPAKWFQKKKKNPEQPLLSSHNNQKQAGWSVGGYTGPGAEILIKASWHLKSSVIRQPIWVKRAPFWLSHFRPTPERGATQANKASGKSRHLFSRRDTKHETGQPLDGVIKFHRGSLCVHYTCYLHVCHLFWPGGSILHRALSRGLWPRWNCQAALTGSCCPSRKGGVTA